MGTTWKIVAYSSVPHCAAHVWPMIGTRGSFMGPLEFCYLGGAPECTSVQGIGIVVLNKYMKCATKNQSLLASMPCSHKSHMITLVAVHNFIFI